VLGVEPAPRGLSPAYDDDVSRGPDTRMGVDLGEACAVWQSERQGSSTLRGAARVLTGLEHYFSASYIRDYEEKARAEPWMLERAGRLMTAIANSNPRTADGWCADLGLPASGFAGRGLQSKSDEDEDDQILERLEPGEIISMPLWGISLDREIARKYASDAPRFRFELEGPFQGLAASRESGDKPEEREIITGGRYELASVREEDGITVASFRQLAQVWPVTV
jgi:hypothetical protein